MNLLKKINLKKKGKNKYFACEFRQHRKHLHVGPCHLADPFRHAYGISDLVVREHETAE